MICPAPCEDPAADAVYVLNFCFLFVSFLSFTLSLPSPSLYPSTLRSINFCVSNFIHYNDFPSTLTLTFTLCCALLFPLLYLSFSSPLLDFHSEYFGLPLIECNFETLCNTTVSPARLIASLECNSSFMLRIRNIRTAHFIVKANRVK